MYNFTLFQIAVCDNSAMGNIRGTCSLVILSSGIILSQESSVLYFTADIIGQDPR